MYESIWEHQSVNIRQISRNRAEQVAYYRFLENEDVTLVELAQTLSVACQQQVAGHHVLAISDTSEINLQSHAGRLHPENLGVVGNNHDVGFFIHPTLVLDAATGFPLGISAVQMWTRDPERLTKEERKYSTLPIEKKESFKWIASAERSGPHLASGNATKVTHIGDRESDIYEVWCDVPDGYHHQLVRVRTDRNLAHTSKSLYEVLDDQAVEGTYSVEILPDARLQRLARTAWLSVRFTPVQIQRPSHLSVHDYPPQVKLWAVDAREINPPKGQKAIHWRLLTTHCIETIEQALQIILWYRWRWRIEQLFATLKRAGLDLESSQLESVEAIQRLTILGLSVAMKILQLLEGRDRPDLEATLALTEKEQDCLRSLAPTLDGKTKKQQNPHPPYSLAWSTWLIARLGGASGYQSQRPPGIPTLIQGWRRFEAIFLGWKLSQI